MKFALLLIMAMATAFAAPAKKREIIFTDDNVISLKSAFTGESVANLIEQAARLDSRLPSGQPIYLFLRTPGGEIQAGLELFEYLKGLNRPVHTVTLFAASMGFQTVQQLGERLILENGVLMSHKAAGGFQGEFGGGVSQMDSRYGLWLRRVQKLDRDTVVRTNGRQTLKTYQASYANELWLNGDEAVAQGYADAVVTVKCDASLEGKFDDVIVTNAFFSATVRVPRCPLRTKPSPEDAKLVTNRGQMSLQEFAKLNPSFKTCEEMAIMSAPDNVVCTLDPTLNMSKINDEIQKIVKSMTEDLSTKVIRN